MNYGLRGAESDGDEQHCRELCDRLGRAADRRASRARSGRDGKSSGACPRRPLRHAERLAAGDYATGHTRSDEAETVLYRLASSPGSRALAGISPRRGRLIRPLLGQTREQTREYCRSHSLPWRDDRSNADSTFARTRVRDGLLPALTEISPGAEAALAETAAQVREEAALLELAVDDAITRLGGERIELVALALEPPGLARLVIRRLGERAVGRPCPVDRAGAARVLALEGRPGTASVDLVAGARAVVEYGVLRLEDGSAEAPEQPAPQPLMIPGEARYGDWRISAELGGGGEAVLLASALGSEVTVRGWREGDRIEPDGARGVEVAPGPVHRRQGAALAASPPAARRGRRRDRVGRRAGNRRAVQRPARAAGDGLALGAPDHARLIGPHTLAAVRDPAIGKILVQRDDLAHRVRELGEQITADYQGRELFLVGVLKGAVFFLSDLMRHVDVPCQVDFMAVSSYGSMTESSGVVRILKDLDAPIAGRDVLIVEDIVDSGPDPALPAADAEGAPARFARGLRAADQAGAAQGRAADPSTSASRSPTASRSATASTTASATATFPTWRRSPRRPIRPAETRPNRDTVPLLGLP